MLLSCLSCGARNGGGFPRFCTAPRAYCAIAPAVPCSAAGRVSCHRALWLLRDRFTALQPLVAARPAFACCCPLRRDRSWRRQLGSGPRYQILSHVLHVARVKKHMDVRDSKNCDTNHIPRETAYRQRPSRHRPITLRRTAARTRPPLSPGKDPRQNSRNLEGAGDGKAQHQSAIRCSRHRSKCQEAATDAPPARLTFGESEEKGCLTFERAVCCPQSPARQCTATLSLERCRERPASSLVKQLANTGPAL